MSHVKDIIPVDEKLKEPGLSELIIRSHSTSGCPEGVASCILQYSE